MTTEVQQLLEKLASTLGTTAEHLWGVLLKQAVIYGWFRVVVIVLNIAAVYIAIKAFQWTSRLTEEGWDEAVYTAPLVFSVLVFMGAIINVFTLDMVIAAFANPDYLALTWVLEALK